jgi:hypothetical protein
MGNKEGLAAPQQYDVMAVRKRVLLPVLIRIISITLDFSLSLKLKIDFNKGSIGSFKKGCQWVRKAFWWNSPGLSAFAPDPG